jgi:hypothetical protein
MLKFIVEFGLEISYLDTDLPGGSNFYQRGDLRLASRSGQKIKIGPIQRSFGSQFEFCPYSLPAVLIIKNQRSRIICFFDDGLTKSLRLANLLRHFASWSNYREMRSVFFINSILDTRKHHNG